MGDSANRCGRIFVLDFGLRLECTFGHWCSCVGECLLLVVLDGIGVGVTLRQQGADGHPALWKVHTGDTLRTNQTADRSCSIRGERRDILHLGNEATARAGLSGKCFEAFAFNEPLTGREVIFPLFAATGHFLLKLVKARLGFGHSGDRLVSQFLGSRSERNALFGFGKRLFSDLLHLVMLGFEVTLDLCGKLGRSFLFRHGNLLIFG